MKLIYRCIWKNWWIYTKTKTRAKWVKYLDRHNYSFSLQCVASIFKNMEKQWLLLKRLLKWRWLHWWCSSQVIFKRMKLRKLYSSIKCTTIWHSATACWRYISHDVELWESLNLPWIVQNWPWVAYILDLSAFDGTYKGKYLGGSLRIVSRSVLTQKQDIKISSSCWHLFYEWRKQRR